MRPSLEKISFEADPKENYRTVFDGYIKLIVEELGYSKRDAFQLESCFEEVYTNAQKTISEGMIGIEFNYSKDAYVLKVSRNGKPFDDIDEKISEQEESRTRLEQGNLDAKPIEEGTGLLDVESMMDEFYFDNTQNSCTAILKKYI